VTTATARRGRRRLVLRWAAAFAVVLAIVVAALGLRALRVLWSVDDANTYWEVRAARAAEPDALVYVALGDSAAQGVGASRPEKGYVGLLADEFRASTGRPVLVVNLSLSGAAAADVLTGQVDRVDGYYPDVVTLAVGGNDAGRTSPDTFAATMAKIFDQLPAGSYVADVPDFGGGPRRPAAHVLAERTRDLLVEHEDLVPVPLEAATASMGWGDYAGDFFHPSDSGYRVWADAFWTAMRDDAFMS
jgi:lysophospholipase L1-like esterase